MTIWVGGDHKAGDSAGLRSVGIGGQVQEHIYAVDPLCEEAAQALEGRVPVVNEQLVRETAAALAHRACCGTEHDAANGKLHGFCIVCGLPWPCETAQYYLRRADKANDVADVRVGSKESAWHAVWDQLKAHNPKFFELDYNGLGCVIKEIERLQALDETAGAQS
jgi:hypothetical protein